MISWGNYSRQGWSSVNIHIMQEVIIFFQTILKQYNWIDWLIFIVIVLYMFEGYAVGFISGFFDIAGFLFSFSAGLKFYKAFAAFFTQVTRLPLPVANIIGFTVVTLIAGIIAFFIENSFKKKTKELVLFDKPIYYKINNFLGIIPGFFSGCILIAFVLIIIISLPFTGVIKQSIGNAKAGNFFVGKAQGFERDLSSLFGGKDNNLLTFFTVEPTDNATVKLDFVYSEGTVDQAAEEKMLSILNSERVKQDLTPLVMDDNLRSVARMHSKDMLERGYFSHYTPDGKSPFDRMNEVGITYNFAGENLAFSANVDLAMQGLMQSPGHRANILSPNFRKVGIGVIDAGIYGQMFSQEFTD